MPAAPSRPFLSFKGILEFPEGGTPMNNHHDRGLARGQSD